MLGLSAQIVRVRAPAGGFHVAAVGPAVVVADVAVAVAYTLPSKIGDDSVRLSAVGVHRVIRVVIHGGKPSVDHGYWDGASSSSELRADSSWWGSLPEKHRKYVTFSFNHCSRPVITRNVAHTVLVKTYLLARRWCECAQEPTWSA